MKVLALICAVSLSILKLQVNSAAQDIANPVSKPISLRGTVESVEVIQNTSSPAFIRIKLKMELVNTGAGPIIFLKKEPIFPGLVLAKKPEDFGTNNVLAGSYAGPSNNSSPEWATLRSSLDQPSPPIGETRILNPGESWPLEATVGVSVPPGAGKKYTFSNKAENLEVIQQLLPVWLSVICEVWPWNVEPLTAERAKLRFGHKLRKRWSKAGILWLHTIYSEPIKLNIPKSS